MLTDRRNKSPGTPSSLPIDYLKLVEQTLSQALLGGLIEMKKIHPIADFHAKGAIYADEIVVAITLSHGPQNLAATTVYASVDYQPSSPTPGLEATMSAAVDAAGSVFDYYLDPKHPERIKQLSDASLSALEEAPFEWTAVEQSAIPAWVKMDKSNPQLDELAEKWLKENDPQYEQRLKAELEESEEFLEERLEAIKKAKSGSPGGQSGPIRH